MLAQRTGTVKWNISFTYEETQNSSTKGTGGWSKHSLKMAGAVEMIVEAADISNGHLQITTEQGDKVLSSFTSGHVFETTESEGKYPVMVLASTRKDEYTGKALQNDQGFNFEYDPSPNGTKGISGAGIEFDQNGYYEVHQYTPAYSERLDAKYPVTNGSGYRANLGNQKADVITPFKNGFMIDCLISEKNKPTNIDGLETESEKTIEYHAVIWKETDIEAFIVPTVSADEYHKWMPEGPDPKDEKTTGNGLSFTVFTKDKKKPDQKITANIKSVIYSLTNVSHEPDYSMNYPSDKPNTKADLQLLANNEKPDPETEKLNRTLTASQGRDVNVACFDYGAYGRIRATVILNDGTIVVAKEEKSQKPYATIPYRTDDNSEIADYWKEQNKATDLKDNDDNEKQNNLGDDHLGDGLTVYEEYRGFIENKKHIRTDPKKLDLMACDMIKERAKDGIAMFKSVTGINVHDDFTLDEFGKECDASTEGLTHDKCINFNSTPATHIVDQHGLAFIQSMENKGYASAETKVPNGPIGTPHRYKYLEITKDFDPGPDGWSTVMGTLDSAGNFHIDPNGKSKMITDEYSRVVAHEMLHCCNVQHHGDDNDKVKYYRGDSVINGDPSKIYTSTASTAQPVSIYWDDTGAQIAGSDPLFEKGYKVLTIGDQHGVESGNEDCLMRYDNATAYRYTDGKIYVLRKKAKKILGELSGIGLCNSKNGTGVNAPDHQPRPRYGDAELGNCKQQFCINDKYH